MAYWYCYYHVIWATQYRKPIITPYLEPLIYQWIKDKSEAMKSEVLAVNGIEDHIHVAVTIPPTLAATEWVRHVKGYSAHKVNGVFPDAAELFKWQSGYGLITVGPKHLPRLIDYVTHQKRHHAENTVINSLEQAGNDDRSE